MLIAERVDYGCMWDRGRDGSLNLLTYSFGNLPYDGHALDLCYDVAVLECGGFVDNDGAVETMLGADILARDVDRGSHWKIMGTVEMGQVGLTSD
jgi:hypothetical protein